MRATDTTPDWTELRLEEPCRLVVHGHLDVGSARGFRETASQLADEAVVIVDLTTCDFVDAIGLGALVGAVRRQHVSGGTLVLLAPPGSPVAKLLVSTGLDRLTPVSTGRELVSAG